METTNPVNSDLEVVRRRLYFFTCKRCSALKRQSFYKRTAQKKLCRNCRRNVVPKNQTSIFDFSKGGVFRTTYDPPINVLAGETLEEAKRRYEKQTGKKVIEKTVYVANQNPSSTKPEQSSKGVQDLGG